ncbi:MAG: bifunctional phosphoribosyl-AMP cyclohydrolase/phosphoribosyl-ATP diphosphatase HisIE [Methanobacteriota archaeon]
MQPNFEKGNGLVPVVMQDAATREVLTLAYANAEALRRTQDSGEMHFFSRDRQALWKKGETSGNVMKVRSLSLDCDGDAVLASVDPAGPACHTGKTTCFHNPYWQQRGLPAARQQPAAPAAAAASTAAGATPEILSTLWATLQDRKAHPKEGSHTSKLLADENLMLKKVIEEAGEVAMAVRGRSPKEELVHELADLLYHSMVVMVAQGVSPSEVFAELSKRRR